MYPWPATATGGDDLGVPYYSYAGNWIEFSGFVEEGAAVRVLTYDANSGFAAVLIGDDPQLYFMNTDNLDIDPSLIEEFDAPLTANLGEQEIWAIQNDNSGNALSPILQNGDAATADTFGVYYIDPNGLIVTSVWGQYVWGFNADLSDIDPNAISFDAFTPPDPSQGPSWAFLAPQGGLGDQLAADINYIFFGDSDIPSRFVAAVDLFTLGGTTNYIRACVEGEDVLEASVRLGVTAVGIPGAGAVGLAYGLPAVGVGVAPEASTMIIPLAEQAAWGALEGYLAVSTSAGTIIYQVVSSPTGQAVLNSPVVQRAGQFLQSNTGQTIIAFVNSAGTAYTASQTGLTPGDQMALANGIALVLSPGASNFQFGFNAASFDDQVASLAPGLHAVSSPFGGETTLVLIGTEGTAAEAGALIVVIGDSADNAVVRYGTSIAGATNQPVISAAALENQLAGMLTPGRPQPLVIVAHGDIAKPGLPATGVRLNLGNGIVALSPDDLAGLLQQAGVSSDSVNMITLYSCSTGAGGCNSVGYALSESLGIPVFAPTDTLYWSTSGARYSLSDGIRIDNGGRMESFWPDP